MPAYHVLLEIKGGQRIKIEVEARTPELAGRMAEEELRDRGGKAIAIQRTWNVLPERCGGCGGMVIAGEEARTRKGSPRCGHCS